MITILAISKPGVELAHKLAQALPGSTVRVSRRLLELAPGAEGFDTFAQGVEQAWAGSRGLVCVAAAGIVVRTVAPLLRDKRSDPAVVVVDDAGRFAVSLLSGHLGGANDLARDVAAALGGQAVVTTASDALGTLPVDLLGRDLGWALEGDDRVTAVSAALVDGAPVALVRECPAADGWQAPDLPGGVRGFDSLDEALGQATAWKALLVVSQRATEALEAELGPLAGAAVFYRPRTLHLGMGCDRGTPLVQLRHLALEALDKLGLSPLCVAGLASVDLKADEPGLKALALELGCPFTTFSAAALNAVPGVEASSPFVAAATGARAVAEPAALLSAGSGARLLLDKAKAKGCTVAVAEGPIRAGEASCRA